LLQERDIGLGVISRVDALVPQDQPNCWNHGKVDRMNEVSTDQIKRAVEATRGGTATFVQSVPLRENFAGKTAWEGVVAVFDLAGHSKANRAYCMGARAPGRQAKVCGGATHRTD
jgi:hypothetical protein